MPGPSETIKWGAIAVLVLLIYNAMIEYLEELLGQTTLEASYRWVEFVIPVVAQKLQALVQDMRGHIPAGVSRATFGRALKSMAKSGTQLGNRILRLAGVGAAVAETGECDSPVLFS